MSAISTMPLAELAAFVCSHLESCDIPVVLVGGACVSIYSHNRYQTSDLDFIERHHTNRKALKAALAEIGFHEKNRYFVHPDASYFLEFPSGPPAVGDQPIQEPSVKRLESGVLRLLTPADCIKDRLAAYFHWNDQQSLQQAIWVAEKTGFDLQEVEAWAAQEGMAEKFGGFKKALVG
jgi:hypothetical protein